MSTYDKAAEEEWYKAALSRAQDDWDQHLRWCVTCDLSDSARCGKGDHIERLVIAASENLRKVTMKNRYY